jgi:hypothetical protein
MNQDSKASDQEEGKRCSLHLRLSQMYGQKVSHNAAGLAGEQSQRMVIKRQQS